MWVPRLLASLSSIFSPCTSSPFVFVYSTGLDVREGRIVAYCSAFSLFGRRALLTETVELPLPMFQGCWCKDNTALIRKCKITSWKCTLIYMHYQAFCILCILSELMLDHPIKKRRTGSLKSVLDFLAAYFEKTESEVRLVSILAGY